jgi:hypothetical protein
LALIVWIFVVSGRVFKFIKWSEKTISRSHKQLFRVRFSLNLLSFYWNFSIIFEWFFCLMKRIKQTLQTDNSIDCTEWMLSRSTHDCYCVCIYSTTLFFSIRYIVFCFRSLSKFKKRLIFLSDNEGIFSYGFLSTPSLLHEDFYKFFQSMCQNLVKSKHISFLHLSISLQYWSHFSITSFNRERIYNDKCHERKSKRILNVVHIFSNRSEIFLFI